MSASDRPTRQVFEEKDYRTNGTPSPIVSVILHASNGKYPIEALVDTGCSVGFAITLPYLRELEERLGIRIDLGKKINSDVEPAILADGTRVAMDKYRVEIEVGSEKRQVSLSLVDPHTRLKPTDVHEKASEPLLGRQLLNNFDVLFSGLSDPKKVMFSKQVALQQEPDSKS